MTPRIQKAIDIFLDALNEGTLAKGTCAACAIGNLVANGMGIKAKIPNNDPFDIPKNNQWANLILNRMYPHMHIMDLEKAIKLVEDNTQFTYKEIQVIEKAFEDNTNIHYCDYCKHSKKEIRQDQLRGLEAVVKVMLTFDDCKESVKEVFTEKAELISIY